MSQPLQKDLKSEKRLDKKYIYLPVFRAPNISDQKLHGSGVSSYVYVIYRFFIILSLGSGLSYSGKKSIGF